MADEAAQQPSCKRSAPRRQRRMDDEKSTFGRSDPFAGSTKNNFPALEDAFVTNNQDKEVSIALTPERDRSVCSFASPQNVSADMSIGARAALSEHRRCISLFGVDGTPTRRKEQDDSQVDEGWNRLLDSSSSQSWIGTSRDGEGHDMSTYHEAEGTAEVSIGNVSDFFDSNRVQCLMTPEKNKEKVDRASHRARMGVGELTGRGCDYRNSYETESMASSNAEREETNESGMAFLFNEALKLNGPEEEESSSASFHADPPSFLSHDMPDDSKVWLESSSCQGKNMHGPKLSSTVTYQEEDCGCVELITNSSQLVPEFQAVSMESRSHDDSFLMSPNRGTKLSSNGKENVDLALPWLSPIVSLAGSMAEEITVQSRAQTNPGEERKCGQSGRLPFSQIGKPEMSNEQSTQEENLANNSRIFSCSTTQKRGGIFLEHPNHQTRHHEGRATRSEAAQSERSEKILPILTFPSSEKQHPNRRKMAIASLKERYSSPDRFEDGFVCFASGIRPSGDEDEFQRAASKSLLSSFDKSFHDSS